MKISIKPVFLLVIFLLVAGCADKKEIHKTQAKIDKDLFLSMSSPVEVGRNYLRNIFYPEKSAVLYGFLSDNVKGKTDLSDFSRTLKDMSANLKTDKATIDVITLDTFVFDSRRIVCYYLIVYENELQGVYFIAELNLIKEFDNWKIDINSKGDELSVVPTLTQGDISSLTRKNLLMAKELINEKIAGYRRDLTACKPVAEPVNQVKTRQDDLEKIIKKEMVVGKVYFDVGNYENARESFEKVLSYDPDNLEAKDYLAETLTEIQRQEKEKLESQKAKEKEIEKKQAVPPVAAPEQIVVPSVAKPEKKPADIQKSVEEELFDKCFQTGKQLYDAGEYRKAMVQFRKALGFRPGNEEILNYIKKCEKAIQLVPVE